VERLGVAPGEAVFVDDFAHNVEGARLAGLHAIHFRSTDQARAELEQLLDSR
jgi:FMN phosphatase YigB (HAD superfamily)